MKKVNRRTAIRTIVASGAAMMIPGNLLATPGKNQLHYSDKVLWDADDSCWVVVSDEFYWNKFVRNSHKRSLGKHSFLRNDGKFYDFHGLKGLPKGEEVPDPKTCKRANV